MIVKVTKY